MRISLSATCLLLAKKRPKKVTRAKYCIKWLPMLYYECHWRNGLGSPFGFETIQLIGPDGRTKTGEMAWEARSGLKPLNPPRRTTNAKRRNGLGSPFGFETTKANLVFPLKELWRNG